MMGIVESPILHQVESQLESKHPLQSRLNKASKPRKIFASKAQENFLWTDEESYSLILFLMLCTDGKTWKDKKFWEDAATFIKQHSQTSHCRTGKIILVMRNEHAIICFFAGVSCRSRATAVLAKQFSSPAAAEPVSVLQLQLWQQQHHLAHSLKFHQKSSYCQALHLYLGPHQALYHCPWLYQLSYHWPWLDQAIRGPYQALCHLPGIHQTLSVTYLFSCSSSYIHQRTY